MSLAALALSAVLAAAPAGGVPETRAPVRCPPAPYYIHDRADTPVVDRQSDQSKATRLGLSEKRTRPCYLTRGDETPTPNRFRTT